MSPENDSISRIADDLYSFLSGRFPISCWSDEFFFFPQALQPDPDWKVWDDFSPDSVEEALQTLGILTGRIRRLEEGGKRADDGDRANGSLLFRIMLVLREQLAHVRTHLSQPTFFLTRVSVGLAQAVQDDNPGALAERLSTLPVFLGNAFCAHAPVPEVFRTLGIEMASNLSTWLPSLGSEARIGPAVEAVEAFRSRLLAAPSAKEFRLGEDLLERVVQYHMGSGAGIRDCLDELEEEKAGSLKTLEGESIRLGHGRDWRGAFGSIPEDPVPGGDKRGLILGEIGRLAGHCRGLGMDPDPADTRAFLAVEPVPPSLGPIRTADSYAARPGFPFRGGVFYIFEGGGIGRAGSSIHPEYRLTAAHEAWPGHHLLDRCRWNGPDPVRRPVEFPVFYEGWACFGEDLMLETGAFERPWDRLILAWRRHAHAVRGIVNLLLHRGDLDFEGAAEKLCGAGFSRDRALATARKYALQPGYQLCYTVGRRRFQALFDARKDLDPGVFVQAVLREGEIPFGDLEMALGKRREKGEGGKGQDAAGKESRRPPDPGS